MAKLIGYAMVSDIKKNSTNSGHLVKAMCELCGKKYGSLEEAKKCEEKHLNNNIFNLRGN